MPGRLGSIARTVGLALGFVVLAALTVVIGFVVRHRDATPVTAAGAQAEFDRLRAQFAGQTALVDMQARSTRSPAATASGRPLRAFHTVIFDRRGGDRLVAVTVPFWLGRTYARHDGSFAWLGELTFLDDTEFDPEPLRSPSTRSSGMAPDCWSTTAIREAASSWRGLNDRANWTELAISVHHVRRELVRFL